MTTAEHSKKNKNSQLMTSNDEIEAKENKNLENKKVKKS